MEKVKSVKINDKITIGGDNQDFVLMAGPCVIENEEMVFEIAEKVKDICKTLNIKYIFKTSFDKANRSSIESYRGPGIEKGLEILGKLKEKTKLPLLIDVHAPEQVEPVSKIADILQIPAFLSRQTDLLITAAKSGKPVNVKKGQFLAPWDMKNVIEKIESENNFKILLTERGASFGYNNLVVDFRGIPIMRKLGYPVIFDATHSAQLPGGKGDSTGGMRESVPFLARAAVAVGIDALFMEVHPKPEKALSDATNMLPLNQLHNLLQQLLKLGQVP